MSRLLTAFKPTGNLQLGNLLGALHPIAARQHSGEILAMIADLHALTVRHDPALVRAYTMEAATLLLAAGIDPASTTVFVQSHVPQHTELHYLLECATSYGDAHRMIQFREKGGTGARLSLLTYPVLMAADILLYDTDEVPVGHDQLQHIELARGVAQRFNNRYGQTFTVPLGVNPLVAARVMDLADPTVKMGKTNAGITGTIRLLDAPDAVRTKIMRAVTAADYAPEQPGVANLLSILAGCVGGAPAALAGQFTGNRALKEAVADAVNATLAPIQEAHKALSPEYVRSVLVAGAERARELAAPKVVRARAAVGLLPA